MTFKQWYESIGGIKNCSTETIAKIAYEAGQKEERKHRYRAEDAARGFDSGRQRQ